MKAIIISAIFFISLLMILSAGLAVSLSGKIPKKTDPLHVELKGDDLYVEGEKFVIKGVTYSPVPPGEDPREKNYNDWLIDDEIYKRDLAMMKLAGINTIRVLNLSGDSLNVKLFLDTAHEYDIKVIMAYIGPIKEDAGDPEVREREKRIALDMVRNYKDHPAILMWMMGNEVNYWYPEDKDVSDWYTLLEEISEETKRIDPNHPIVTANNALADIDDFNRISRSVDIYGTNQYGLSKESWKYIYDGYRETYSRRPILITEFGLDSWDSERRIEDEDTQAEIILVGLDSIENEENSVGAIIFEWSDEWWKSGMPLKRNCEKDWQPFDKQGLPDGWFSEECFGIVKYEAGSNEKIPKKVYYELQKRWSDPNAKINPTISYVKTIDNDGTIEAGVVTYGGVGADVTLHYKTTFGGWQEVHMQRDDWRYVAKVPDKIGILSYRVVATDIYQRSAEKEGKFFTY